MKQKVWIDENHMLFESSCKTFNKQCNCISTGNVVSTVQLSSYIRPFNETECNGRTFEPGHLRDYDLEFWRKKHTPQHVLNAVIDLTNAGKKVILYAFRHWDKGNERVHGYVITDDNHRLLKTFFTGRTYKSISVIQEAIKYITE